MSVDLILEPKVENESPIKDLPELNRCPYCSEVILSEAKKCKHCGEFLDPALKKSVILQPKWNPAIAAALSLVVPGGGHIYRGKILAGCLWAFLVAVGYGAYILPGLILHLTCISLAAIGNPYEK